MIYKVLKIKTVRPRPYQVHQVIRLGEHPLDHFSFPSGHTLHARDGNHRFRLCRTFITDADVAFYGSGQQCPEWCWDCIIQVMWQLAQFWVA